MVAPSCQPIGRGFGMGFFREVGFMGSAGRESLFVRLGLGLFVRGFRFATAVGDGGLRGQTQKHDEHVHHPG